MTDFHPLASLEDVAAVSESWQHLNKIAEERGRSCGTAQMPSLQHLSLTDYQHVYEPSDDTFLLLDGLKLAMNELKDQRRRICLTVEIGCGTGVPTVFLAKEMTRAGSSSCLLHIVTDINPHAIQAATQTAKANNIHNLEAIQCDLVAALLPRCQHAVDTILFNPPYVPTPDEEVGDNGIEASWAGGTNGRVVIDRAIPQIADLLSKPHGVAFMITVDDNLPEEIAETFKKLGLTMTPYVRRRARNEFLTVQRIEWVHNNLINQ